MRNFLLAFLLFAANALAVDVNGRWKGEAIIDGQTSPVHINLVQQGNTLKGTGGPNAVDQDLLTNVTIAGNKISFDAGPPGRTAAHFELSASDYELKGTVKAMRGSQAVTGQVLLRKRTD